MSSVQVRRFNRHDRDQVTALVNAHISAVVPGVSVSVQALMSQLEGEPGEFIIGPWVDERATLVVEQRGRIVAAAHLLRYGGEIGSLRTIGIPGKSAGCCTGLRPPTGRTPRRPPMRWDRPALPRCGRGA